MEGRVIVIVHYVIRGAIYRKSLPNNVQLSAQGITRSTMAFFSEPAESAGIQLQNRFLLGMEGDILLLFAPPYRGE